METYYGFKLEWRDRLGHARTEPAPFGVKVSGYTEPEGGRATEVFSIQSTPSTSSNPDAEKTPEQPEESSAQRESEEPSRPPQSGGETVDALLEHRVPMTFSGKPSAPASPPTTPANGQPTKSEPMTTPSAECSSNSGSCIMARIQERAGSVAAALGAAAYYLDNLKSTLNDAQRSVAGARAIATELWNICASTTPGAEEPAVDGEKLTSPDTEGTERK